MSSPLVTNGKKKSQPLRIEIAIPAEMVGLALTVMVLKDGRVELNGPLQDVDTCLKCLDLGIARMKQYAEYQQAVADAESVATQ